MIDFVPVTNYLSCLMDFYLNFFRSLIQATVPSLSSSFSSPMNHIVILLGHVFMMAQLATLTVNLLWNASAIFHIMRQVTVELLLACLCPPLG